MRGKTIRQFIWCGVIDEGGKVCGTINVETSPDRFPIQIQCTEAEMFHLAGLLRDTARELKRRGGARDPARSAQGVKPV